MNKLISAVSPHFHTPRDTQKIMLDVIIALVPAEIASAILFGWRALLVVAVCAGTCVLSEFLFEKLCKRDVTIYDLSAVVTGMILAFNLPVTIPLWQAALGSVTAIIVVKQLFGGIGQNFANPAATARIVMIVAFSGEMTKWVNPVGFFTDVDALSTATPLVAMSKGGDVPSYLDLFLGNHAGCLGETCALALLLGGVYLLVRRVITWHAPVAFIGTVALMSLVCGKDVLGRSDARRDLHGDRLRKHPQHQMGQDHLRRRLRSDHRSHPLLGQLSRGRELLDSHYEHPHPLYREADALQAFDRRC